MNTCKTCRFWRYHEMVKHYGEMVQPDPLKWFLENMSIDRFACVRHSPDARAGFPATHESEWCGDHEAMEAKPC